MRERYETLALVDLRAIAKSRGIKGTSSMKKEDVINAMVDLDEKEKREKEEANMTASSESAKKDEQVSDTAPKKKTKTKVIISGPKDDEKSKAKSASRSTQKSQPSQAVQTQEAQVTKTQEAQVTKTQEAQVTKTQEAQPEQNITKTMQNAQATQAQTQAAQAQATQAQAAQAQATQAKATQAQADQTQESQTSSQPASQPEQNAEQVARDKEKEAIISGLDSGVVAKGILEIMPDGFGFIRSENYLPGESDVYVAPSQIRRFGMKTGDIVAGNTRIKSAAEKFSALLYVKSINGYPPEVAAKRPNFEDMTPIFPDEKLKLETPGAPVAMRIMDVISPVGKGQRGMIVSPPKAGKTTLLKNVAQSVLKNNPEIHLIILLIDERPEEVTDIKEAICGDNVEVIYSTFDELPEHHKRVAEMVMERAKRLVEHKQDVMILLDSITRLTRAYNLTVPPSGRTLSGGLDPAALHMPKKFFGAARNMREGGSLTVLATALVDTGSKMDDVVYEEFKGTGNMEMVLDRKLSERRVFPAIDIPKSGTRREDLLLTPEEIEAVNMMRRAFNGMKGDEAVDRVIELFTHTKSNVEFVHMMRKMRIV